MRSLFLRIFLWFWATVVVTGLAFVLTFIVEPRSVPSRWYVTMTDTARYAGAIAVETSERQGTVPAAAYMERLAAGTHMNSCLFNSKTKVIAGTGCDDLLEMASHVMRSKGSDFSMKYGVARVALMLTSQSGRDYIFATELPAGPRAALGISRGALFLQWSVALLVSGLICSLLTRYLTTPVLRLQETSRRLTAGELSARVGPDLEQRQDEIGELVRDFNAMACRIEELIHRQRQLTSDVSHELRSPLARLNVALDLARERKGDDPAFGQMEADIALLDEMIGRLLTLAKMDASATQIPMTTVDVAELLSDIVRDAEFEFRDPHSCITVRSSGGCVVRGDAELLRSALGNVVRNAIRFTRDGSPVEVRMQTEGAPGMESVRISVRDHGPGVPESELKNIFQPFYRVATARDRQSGGTGLGLAIADRAIRFYGGTIWAENVAPHGLRVEIVLPRSSSLQFEA